MPYVVDELCNGCGICENVCPLEGKAGIEVFAVKDRTPLQAPGEQQPVFTRDEQDLPDENNETDN